MTIRHFKQEKKNTCGVAALRMVFDYFGESVSEKEILKQVKLHSFGTFLPDLGAYALKKGYKVTIYTFHLPIFASLQLPFGTKITKKIISKINARPKDKMTIESMSGFINKGGCLIWETPKISILQKLTKADNPVIVGVYTSAVNDFYKVWNNGHLLVLERINKNKAYVIDPGSPGPEARYTIKAEILLPAISMDALEGSGYLMMINK